MAIQHDTLFLYRFDVPVDRIYGPRGLEWIGQRYGARPECECAPADVSGAQAAGPWRPVNAWLTEMLPAPEPPAKDRQMKRLANLKVPHDPGTLTHYEARRLIQEAEGGLPPTKSQIQMAEEMKIALPDAPTRANVEALIDSKKRSLLTRLYNMVRMC